MRDFILPFTWVGSKYRLSPWLVDHFPKHQTYLEPFAGTASVLLRKPRAPIEGINDINGALITFFRVLRDREDELVRSVMLTPYSVVEFENAVDDPELDDLERARRFFIRSNSTFGGNHGGGWSASYTSVQHTRGGKWVKAISGLHIVADRLAGVQIHNSMASVVIDKYDDENCLMYVDPPYLGETRSGSKYNHDLESAEAHEQLLKRLDAFQGAVLLSGYDSELYRDLLPEPKWFILRKEMAAHTGSSKTGNTGRRTELVWTNVNPRDVLLQHDNEESE